MSESKKNEVKKTTDEKTSKTEVLIEDFSEEKPVETESFDDDEDSEDTSADDKNFPDTLV